MTLMVRGYMTYNNVGLILFQMSSSPGIVSLSCMISNRDLHSIVSLPFLNMMATFLNGLER
jgi:hypothetical protein